MRIIDFQGGEAHALSIEGKVLLIGTHLKGKGGRDEGRVRRAEWEDEKGECGGREAGREGRTISKGERLVRKAVLALNML